MRISPARLVFAFIGALVVTAVFATSAFADGSQGTAVLKGTSSPQGGPQGSDTITRGQLEFPPGERAEDEELTGGSNRPAGARAHLNNHPLNMAPFSRSHVTGGRAPGPEVAATAKAAATAQLQTDWHGLDHRATRLADGGNQFSGEPPDQGLCAGGGYVLESVNQAVRIYDSNGTPLSGVVSLNQFYGLPPAIDRTTFTFGPFIFDPDCHYDPASQRWFHIAAMIEQDEETGAFTGFNAILLAVSKTANPLGEWNVYEIPATNNGDFSTPNHNCGPEPGDPCFGDFPHIGVDAFGVYITTNEFSFFGPGFFGAQVYALSKQKLAAGQANVPFVLINTRGVRDANGLPGFSVWPAKSADSEFELAAGGTEYFLSSTAVFSERGTSNNIVAWALTNTSSLNAANPSLELRNTVVNVQGYAVPLPSEQKPGPIPLAECINDTVLPTPFGPGCWQMLFVEEPEHDETLGRIDSGDSRFTDVRFAHGRLWGVLSTQVRFQGAQNLARTGAAWYILDPKVNPAKFTAKLDLQGVLADRTANFTYPTIGISTSGRGVMGFSFMSSLYHPSAGYAPIDDKTGVGEWAPYELGKSPQDGFTEYKAFGEPTRPRWGDYSNAAVVGDTVFIATEYIGMPPCTLTGVPPYNGAPPWYYPFPGEDVSAFAGFGSCLVGNPTPELARTSLANWGTRIGKFSTK